MATANQKPEEPAGFEALYALANRQHHAGRLVEATAAYGRILALWPNAAEVHNDLGIALCQQGQLDQALARFEQAIALKPDLAEGYNNLGNVLRERGQRAQAVARFEQAIALRPGYEEAYNNLGIALSEQGKVDEAVAQLERAIALKPDYAEAYHNLGNALRLRDQLDEATARFEQAIALRPDYVEARLNLATCYLVAGDYQRGWPAFEWRLRMPRRRPVPNLPCWTGEPLAGRGLLLMAEHGLGDTLQFLRYARALKARGARVVLACQGALAPLLASHPDVDELFVLGSATKMPHADFYLPLLSAPAVFRTDASTIPSEVPYLSARPELIELWRRELAGVEGYKIGIVWQGSRNYHSDRWRSIPLADFAPLARLPGVRLISLQKGFGSEQVATVGFPVLDLANRLDEAAGPFMDTAAVIRNLDLVVTADSAVGHLAGGLGAAVWTALPFSADWRWLRDRDDSPWYPTVRLFRQTTLGQWSDVFERMAHAVQAHRSESASFVRGDS